MTHAERMAEILEWWALGLGDPAVRDTLPRVTYLVARIDRYEAALREAHAWSLAHGETAIPPAQAHKLRRCIEAALADDEATD